MLKVAVYEQSREVWDIRRRVLVLGVIAGSWCAVLGLPDAAIGDPVEVRITRDFTSGSYERYDGSQDPTMQNCSTSRREQNEPAIALDPNNLDVVVAGANEYCDQATAGNNGWMGYYRSTDGGLTWDNSLIPGYPADTSPAGLASPVHGSCTIASDPVTSFDGDGRLFYGFICFNRSKPVNGALYVTTYDQDGGHYVRTVTVAAGTPATAGRFNDKPNLATDQTNGNVYIAWSEFPGANFLNVPLSFARSTDHGATFSKPINIGSTKGGPFFPDVAVGPDGTIYVSYRTDKVNKDQDSVDVKLVRSTDGGLTFSKPVTVAHVRAFDSSRFSGGTSIECGVGPGACPTGYSFPRFFTISAVAADAAGVHVVWVAEEGTPPTPNFEPPHAQGKIFVRNSADGLTWDEPPIAVDSEPLGHQFMPDIAASDGVIGVVYLDSRADAAFAPELPPGNTASGTNSGGAIDAYLARSFDGGVTWGETRLSTSSNYGFRNGGNTLRVPFWGDYQYVSSAQGVFQAAWTSSHDVVPGADLRAGGMAGADGFDVFQTCAWEPNDVFAPSYSAPLQTDPCLSQGGKDQNIYTARVP